MAKNIKIRTDKDGAVVMEIEKDGAIHLCGIEENDTVKVVCHKIKDFVETLLPKETVYYTTADMNGIIHAFAAHVVETYEIHSRRFGMKMDMSPEAMIVVWENSMKQEVNSLINPV